MPIKDLSGATARMLSHMDILYLLVPLALLAVLAIGVAFAYAVLAGQFDDLERPARELVAEDERAR